MRPALAQLGWPQWPWAGLLSMDDLSAVMDGELEAALGLPEAGALLSPLPVAAWPQPCLHALQPPGTRGAGCPAEPCHAGAMGLPRVCFAAALLVLADTGVQGQERGE